MCACRLHLDFLTSNTAIRGKCLFSSLMRTAYTAPLTGAPTALPYEVPVDKRCTGTDQAVVCRCTHDTLGHSLPPHVPR
jgi:hypothetical protein